METELTRRIKEAVYQYKPMIKSTRRTVRYAEEVQTEEGIVDVIRFEDYYPTNPYRCSEKSCKITGENYPSAPVSGIYSGQSLA